MSLHAMFGEYKRYENIPVGTALHNIRYAERPGSDTQEPRRGDTASSPSTSSCTVPAELSYTYTSIFRSDNARHCIGDQYLPTIHSSHKFGMLYGFPYRYTSTIILHHLCCHCGLLADSESR
jgi:hypothetical protein